MPISRDVVHWQTLPGDEVTRGDVRVTPQSRALTLRWPHGGLVWNRPVAVLVERNGRSERIPIVDVTRVVQLALFGLSVGLFSIALVRLASQGRKRNG